MIRTTRHGLPAIVLVFLLGCGACARGNLPHGSGDRSPLGPLVTATTLGVRSPLLTPQPAATAVSRPFATLSALGPTATVDVDAKQIGGTTPAAGEQPTGTPSLLAAAGELASEPERIRFPSGATATTLTAHLPANGAKIYVIRIAVGQFVEIDATTDGGTGLQFSMSGADGAVIKSLGQPHLKAVVPRTQDYYLRLVGGIDAANYTLSVAIPVRIAFDPGSTRATVTGSLTSQGWRGYVLRAAAGQTMFVETTTTEGAVQVIVAGADGMVLVSGNVATGPILGPLPLDRTQDYLIMVVETSGQGAQYSMTVEIPTTAPATPSPEAGAIRLTFPPSATMGVVQSTIPSRGSQQVIVGVAAGQWMEAALPPQQGIEISVAGRDGTVLQQGGGPIFQGVVPTTQDYVLTLVNYGGETSYLMSVTIPIRIRFAHGSTGATVQGSLLPAMTDRYVLHALGGQTMLINTPTTSGQVTVSVYGVDGTILQNHAAGGHDFGSTLPTTQDYRIDLQAAGGITTRYALDVTIW